VFTNGDDPKLSHILKNSKTAAYYFGLAAKLMESSKKPYDVDFTYCPNCQTKLEYTNISYSHLGKFKCPKCGFSNPKTETFPDLPHPLFGKYNVYNVNAAALVAKQAFGVAVQKIQTALSGFRPAFGRQEVVKYKGRDVLILLSKNPAGFNQSIDAIRSLNKKGNVLLVLNDRIPDGRDVSWIWDVDFENLPKGLNIYISGDRAYDMGLRIKYSSLIHNSEFIIQNLTSAVDTAVDQTKPDEILFILPTYSAMLETRKILTGKKIL
jgi:UDP-N-acetylmuramyl tripeptide synthase